MIPGGGPGNPQELNRYSYALNNPARYTDPTGHCIEILSCTVEGAAAGAAGGTVVAPGPGTILGGVAGGVIGFVVGAAIVVGVGAGIAYLASEVLAADDASNGEGAIYGTGNSKSQPPKARPADVTLDEHGNVVPGEGGASAAESPEQVQTRGYLYRKIPDPNDPNIEYRPDGGQPDGRGGVHPDGHVSGVPRRYGPFDQYNDAHRRGWEPVRDPQTGEHLPSPRGR